MPSHPAGIVAVAFETRVNNERKREISDIAFTLIDTSSHNIVFQDHFYITSLNTFSTVRETEVPLRFALDSLQTAIKAFFDGSSVLFAMYNDRQTIAEIFYRHAIDVAVNLEDGYIALMAPNMIVDIASELDLKYVDLFRRKLASDMLSQFQETEAFDGNEVQRVITHDMRDVIETKQKITVLRQEVLSSPYSTGTGFVVAEAASLASHESKCLAQLVCIMLEHGQTIELPVPTQKSMPPANPPMNAPPMNPPPMNAPPMNAPPMNAPPMNAPPMNAPPMDYMMHGARTSHFAPQSSGVPPFPQRMQYQPAAPIMPPPTMGPKAGQFLVKMRGLPFKVTIRDIDKFIHPAIVKPGGIVFEATANGRFSGCVLIDCVDQQSKDVLLTKNRQRMNDRYIEIWSETMSTLYTTLQWDPVHQRVIGHATCSDGSLPPDATNSTLYMRDFPDGTTDLDIREFFTGFTILEISFGYGKAGKTRAAPRQAWLTYATPQEAARALNIKQKQPVFKGMPYDLEWSRSRNKK
ncbi:hypothetical protein PCE1_004689 [Barthelona sp. PCE]